MSRTAPRRRPSRVQRERLFLRANGHCERCKKEIGIDSFHVAHLRAHNNGGALVDENLEAWCSECNLVVGPNDVSDTRVRPREWQLKALDRVMERITQTKAATVAAAPGAGKTIFASLVFEALYEADLVDRMVVLAPKVALVQQWHDSVYKARHVELKSNSAVERTGQAGVIMTYQSLNADSVAVHRRQAELARTLFVLDEVHHVGESNTAGQRPGWARYVTELVGDVQGEIHAAGVLNLSGTLWRSQKTERISTVRYVTDDDGKIVSDVDFEVTATELIRQGQLRPVDLFRRGATVELVNLAAAERIVSRIADLDDASAARAAIRELPSDPTWRAAFVQAVLDRLERRHRDLGNGPVKALIVARSQADARAFQETVNRQMKDRGLAPIAELAVSDDVTAKDTLKRFRSSKKVGVICTVDMAGEGYDCPDIVVVGFASNKLTPLYVRQVVARAQRVTAYEREKIGRPIPAAIVIPDEPNLVSLMSSILVPMRHELKEPEADAAGGSEGEGANGRADGPTFPKYILDGVDGHVDGDARVTGEPDGDVAMSLVKLVEPEARRVGLPESDAPRILVAVRSALTAQQDATPFDPPSGAAAQMAGVLFSDTTPRQDPPQVEPLSIERHADAIRQQLTQLANWWYRNGDKEVQVQQFNYMVNNAAGIGKKGRETADLEQLKIALEQARQIIAAHCTANRVPLPRIMRSTG